MQPRAGGRRPAAVPRQGRLRRRRVGQRRRLDVLLRSLPLLPDRRREDQRRHRGARHDGRHALERRRSSRSSASGRTGCAPRGDGAGPSSSSPPCPTASPRGCCSRTGGSAATGTAIYMVVAVLFYFTCLTLFYVPYGALAAELTSDYDERTSLNTYRTLFSQVGALVGAAAPLALNNVLGDLLGSERAGWSAAAAILGAVSTLGIVWTWHATRGREHHTQPASVRLRDVLERLPQPLVPHAARRLRARLGAAQRHRRRLHLLRRLSHGVQRGLRQPRDADVVPRRRRVAAAGGLDEQALRQTRHLHRLRAHVGGDPVPLPAARPGRRRALLDRRSCSAAPAAWRSRSPAGR